MHVTWDPETEGEEKQTWQFHPDDVLRKDAQLIEKHYGEQSFDQWIMGLQLGKIDARTVLLWYMLKLMHPKYRFEDVPDFRVRQLTVEMGTREIESLWKRARRMKLTDDQREAFEAQVVEDMRDAMAREGLEGDVRIEDDELVMNGKQRKALPKPQ